MPVDAPVETASLLARVDTAKLIDALHAIVLVLDREGRVIYFNAHLEQESGRRLADMRGKDWFATFLPTAEQARQREAFALALTAGARRGDVSPILTSDGRLRQIEWYLETLKGEAGEVAGVISVGHDISERVLAAARVRDLEHASRRRERLADIGAITAKVVHDLGNPLAALSMLAQLILRRARRGDFQPAEAVAKPVENILLTLRRLESLVREFTEFAREQRLELREVALDAFVHNIVDLWRDYAAGQGVEISARLAPGTPVIKADEEMLRRVLDNVVKNALDAQPDGGAIVVRTELATRERIAIAVADNGSGIAPDLDVFRLFETTKPDGSGIGLAIARQIVLAHGGVIDHSPQRPRGTVFRIELPIAGPEGMEIDVAPSRF